MPLHSPIGFELSKKQREALASTGTDYVKTNNPTVNDDITQGYEIWDKWRNTSVTPVKAFECLDNTEGAAVWSEVGGGGDVLYTNTTPTPLELGGIAAGSTFEDKTSTEMWDNLLYPELFPDLTNPSSTFVMSPSGLREIGEVIASITFASSFNRGTIDPAYGTSGYRSGLPNTYNYTGTGLVNNPSTDLTDAQSISDYTVISGNQQWIGSVSYDAGEQPLSNKGNDYESPLEAGTTSNITRTITGVYPVFATTSVIDTLTKQTLASMTSTYFQVSMVAEDTTNKQTIDFSVDWANITGIQFYNTVSGAWEWLAGNQVNSLTTFTVSSITHDVQGSTINYDRYTHNGSQIGARQLRFYTN